MLALKRLFRFYVNASVHVALGVISLYLTTIESLSILVNKNLVGFLFFATIVCYNFVKYGVEADKYLIVARPSHKPIQIFSFFSFVAAIWFLLNLGRIVLPLIIILTLISILYAVPLTSSKKNLRSLLGLKVVIVALVWTGFTVLLPVLVEFRIFDRTVFMVCAQNFVLVAVLMVPFEIRDLKYDKLELRTLPQRFGVLHSKYIGYALSFFYLSLKLIGDGWGVRNIVFSATTFGLLVIALYFTKENQSKYYASFGVEGVPVFLLLVDCVLGRLV